jgi:predicted Zn-dependent protease
MVRSERYKEIVFSTKTGEPEWNFGAVPGSYIQEGKIVGPVRPFSLAVNISILYCKIPHDPVEASCLETFPI